MTPPSPPTDFRRGVVQFFLFTGDIGYTFVLKVCAPGYVQWCDPTVFRSGSLSKDSLEETSENLRTASGTMSSKRRGENRLLLLQVMWKQRCSVYTHSRVVPLRVVGGSLD